MPRLAVMIDVDAPPEAVFDLIHDYDRRLDWDPFLRRADVLGGATSAGVGVRTLCVARWRSGGLGMETEYVSFQRPLVAAVRMTRGPWFLATFAASLRQESLPSGGSRVTYQLHFESRPRWARRLVDPVFRWTFRRETQARLRCLKAALERDAEGN